MNGEWVAPISVEFIEVSRPSSLDSSNVVHTACNTSTIIDLYTVGDKGEACGTLSRADRPKVVGQL